MDRLTEIEERTLSDSQGDLTATLDCVSDRLWLIAKVRELARLVLKGAKISRAAINYVKASSARLDASFEWDKAKDNDALTAEERFASSQAHGKASIEAEEAYLALCEAISNEESNETNP